MLFEWNEATMRWQLDAARYTDYPARMAELLLAQMPVRGTLCDIGCGMALVDLALAPQFSQITCVDINDTVLDFVRAHALAQDVGSISVRKCDGAALEGMWDTVLAQFQGDIASCCVPYLKKARDRLIYVTHATALGSTGPAAYRLAKCGAADKVSAWLDAQGWVYARQDGALEFGQPHRSFADAVASTMAFCPAAPVDAVRETVRQTAVETGREDFPLYTPKTRRFAIFNIPRAGNEHLL